MGYLLPRGPYSAAMIAAFGMAAECDVPGIIGAPKLVSGVHLTRLTADGEKAPNADGKAKQRRTTMVPVTTMEESLSFLSRSAKHCLNRSNRLRPV